MIRNLILPAIAAFSLTAGAFAYESPEEAQSFVQTNAQDVIDILEAYQAGERALEDVQVEFRARIDDIADVERITNFVLGRYRRTAGEDELDEFRDVFKAYAIQVYEQELTNYAGQTLTVTGVTVRDEDDFIVHSNMIGPNETIEVNWRVQERDGKLQILDVEVAGIWLAQTQREQILSIIGNNGGRVSAATEELRGQLGE